MIRRFCSPDTLSATFHHARGINPTIFPNSNEGSKDVRVCGSRWAVFTREKVLGLEGRPLAASSTGSSGGTTVQRWCDKVAVAPPTGEVVDLDAIDNFVVDDFFI